MEETQSDSDLIRSTLFYSDQRLCSADILSPVQARARIEVAVLNFLKTLSSPNPAVSDLHLINRRSENCGLRRGLLSDVLSVFLSHSFCRRSLMRANDAKAFVRVWKVMEMCFMILGEDKLVTQRELFYRLLSDSPQYFNSQEQVNSTVQDVVSLLRCTRHSLGLMASSRGAIIGRLILHDPGEESLDCTILGSAGHAISGDFNLLKNLAFQSDARYIIVVEKDAVFQRLSEDRLFNQLPSILITAKGYPDLATRFLLHRLSETFPSITIFALVDWNPAGLAILCTYKFGSISMGLESYRYACNVKWLGLREGDLHLIPESAFLEFKPRDHQISKSLLSSTFLPDSYKMELQTMVEAGRRAEIEALYCHGFDFLGKYIAGKIVQADYI
ncbi:Meiotic recombination protein SPO11-2 [Rhynchospora pubera]|uniref:DNA topoisomerase (ATP-hydrolyzing) n=1 Tax=Rhynchospora pubera TaxID=906938 RepID=A0AAV8GIL2_9POAL|nr:Meiotic recombination protein SPO11-2 [Rhynchospora pubera]